MKNLFLFIFIFLVKFCYGQFVLPINSSDTNFSYRLAFEESQNIRKFKGSALPNVRGISIDSLKGKITIINFWFGACPPCVIDIPFMDTLYKELKDNPDFLFYTVTFDNIQTTNELRQKFNFSFPVINLTDEECTKLLFHCFGYPITYILDRYGKILDIGSYYDVDFTKKVPVLLEYFNKY